MYIPHEYRQPDRAAAVAFMRRYPFAAIVSIANGEPVATHLPFYIATAGDDILLHAHFARANPQWKGLKDAMVIFSGPHAYVSPEHYNKEESVPTWNYIAVHVWGTVQLIDDEAAGIRLLEDLMLQSDAGYMSRWARLSDDYKRNLYRGIVPFTLTVTKLEAAEKLSQNKRDDERERIASALAQSADGAAADISRYMRHPRGMD